MTGKRALDREVERLVFGKETAQWVCDNDIHVGGKITTLCPECVCMVPEYSTHPAACSLVKKRLREAGIEFHIVHYNLTKHRSPDAKGVSCNSMDYGISDAIGADCATEEEAVCLFAIDCAKQGLLEVKA